MMNTEVLPQILYDLGSCRIWDILSHNDHVVCAVSLVSRSIGSCRIWDILSHNDRVVCAVSLVSRSIGSCRIWDILSNNDHVACAVSLVSRSMPSVLSQCLPWPSSEKRKMASKLKFNNKTQLLTIPCPYIVLTMQ